MNRIIQIQTKNGHKNSVILSALIIFMLMLPLSTNAQLWQTYFLSRSPVNSYFYPIKNSYYFDISSVMSSEKISEGFQQIQANVFIPFSSKQMALITSLVRENHFLMQQNFLQFAYLYEVNWQKYSSSTFHISLNYSNQSIDADKLIFPSDLDKQSTTLIPSLNYFLPGNFLSLSSGIKAKYKEIEIKASWRNMAIIYQNNGNKNSGYEYFAELSYTFQQKNKNYSAQKLQPAIAYLKYGDWKIFQSGIRWMNNRYFTEFQTEWIEFLPEILTLSVGISLGNTIFAYQNTSTLNSTIWPKGQYNGIKIAFEIKKYKKSEDRHAISCPQF